MSKELDADIDRMLSVYRNRKTLGFSYYEATGHGGAVRTDPQVLRDRAAARQRAYQARQKALGAQPSA